MPIALMSLSLIESRVFFIRFSAVCFSSLNCIPSPFTCSCSTSGLFEFFVKIEFQPLKDVSEKVEKGYRMEIPDGCPQAMYVLMQRCWNSEPSRRPSFSDILKTLRSTARETIL